MYQRLVVIVKHLGIFLATAAAVCAAYVAVGLPIPATQASVEAKIAPVTSALISLHRSQVTIIGDLAQVQRQNLRNEKFTLMRASETADPIDKINLSAQIGRIEDDMARLDRREAQPTKLLESN